MKKKTIGTKTSMKKMKTKNSLRFLFLKSQMLFECDELNFFFFF